MRNSEKSNLRLIFSNTVDKLAGYLRKNGEKTMEKREKCAAPH